MKKPFTTQRTTAVSQVFSLRIRKADHRNQVPTTCNLRGRLSLQTFAGWKAGDTAGWKACAT
jgi:hypothetical protein